MEKARVFAVFGLGTFGFEVCKVLSEKGATVIGIDNQAKLIERIKDVITQAVLIDSTNEDELKNLSLNDIDAAIVAIGESVESNIITTALLKKLGIPYILSRAVTDIHAKILRQIGATEVINVEIEQGRKVAERLFSPDVFDRIPISKELLLVEMAVPKKLIGKTIYEANIRDKYDVNVASIKKTIMKIDEEGKSIMEEIVELPKPATILEENDVLVVIGANESIEGFKEK